MLHADIRYFVLLYLPLLVGTLYLGGDWAGFLSMTKMKHLQVR